ncbi:hypothetical protein HDA40_002136 [Hamadaea flava]|uniref:VWA domain-containing protein n=1 Tax=Hamadaea flava TaxID=1742688 RepID=A0ABV8LLL3_9ACTN|nr:VWA domain-containing protein [Hamadaea flava]MCP2323629.1 hypothetical protein [Hamadaea flava]
MASHVTPAGAAITHPPIAADWKPWSDTWTQLVQRLSPRRDLTVIVTPGAGQGSPACMTVPDATIEVNADHVTVDPTVADPTDLTMRPLYATGWGLLVHEAAHADHTRWPEAVDDTCDRRVLDAAMLLEEARSEHRHLARRPRDRQWLTAATTELLLDIPPLFSRADAATAAALLLARVDAGILTVDVAADARQAIRAILGGKLLTKLEKIWRRALRTRDDDHSAMIEWADQWVRALGHVAHQLAPEAAGRLRQAIEAVVAVIAAQVHSDAIDALNELARRQRAAQNATEQAIRAAAKRAAEQLFRRPATVATRPPADAERAACGKLTRALRDAALREPTVTIGAAPVPPGRLRVRAAMSNQIQTRMGQTPTSEPWRRKTRQPNPRPPLRAGIAVDVSGSMAGFLDPAAVTTWLLANATSRLPGSATATVIFGDQTRAITRPGQPLAGVPILPQDGATEGLLTAIDALDDQLGLSAAGHSARLLVIVSDGWLDSQELALCQGRLDRLARAGCGLLWIGPENSLPLRGGRIVLADDTATIADLITSAAVDALRER